MTTLMPMIPRAPRLKPQNPPPRVGRPATGSRVRPSSRVRCAGGLQQQRPAPTVVNGKASAAWAAASGAVTDLDPDPEQNHAAEVRQPRQRQPAGHLRFHSRNVAQEAVKRPVTGSDGAAEPRRVLRGRGDADASMHPAQSTPREALPVCVISIRNECIIALKQ